MHTTRANWLTTLTSVTALASILGTAHAATPARNCQAGKNIAVGEYAGCRQKAEAKFATTLDGGKRTAELAKCATKYRSKWPALEAKAASKGSACPSVGDQAAIQGLVDQHTGNIGTALGGGVLQDCSAELLTCEGSLGTCNSSVTSTQGNLTACTGNLGTCTTGLATCNTSLATTQSGLTTCNSTLSGCNTNLTATQTSLTACTGNLGTCNNSLTTCQNDLTSCRAVPTGQSLKTGQTLCYNALGTVIACTGSGQDGEFQKGLTRSYTDNGNGTITDNQTGLMWEKLSDDGSIQDTDTTYTWTTAVTTKIAALNADRFGGFDDWRLPNRNELDSLVNVATTLPSVFSEFNTSCAASCTVLTCSCTKSGQYWSSSTYQLDPTLAWDTAFTSGVTEVVAAKTANFYVRAVRGGS